MHNSDQIIPPILSKGFDPTSPSRFREICHTPLNQKAHIVGLFLGSYSAWNLHNYAFLAPLIFFVSQQSVCLHIISFSIVHKTHPHLPSLSRSFHTWTGAKFETNSRIGEGSRDSKLQDRSSLYSSGMFLLILRWLLYWKSVFTFSHSFWIFTCLSDLFMFLLKFIRCFSSYELSLSLSQTRMWSNNFGAWQWRRLAPPFKPCASLWHGSQSFWKGFACWMFTLPKPAEGQC